MGKLRDTAKLVQRRIKGQLHLEGTPRLGFTTSSSIRRNVRVFEGVRTLGGSSRRSG